MSRELAIRALGLYMPIALAGALWYWRYGAGASDAAPTQPPRMRSTWHFARGHELAAGRVSPRRLLAALLLASAWCAPALLVVHVAATRAGYWTFHATQGLFAGMPVDLYLGWIVLWGIVPVLAFPVLPLPLVIAAMVLLDLVLMPLCAPVVRLGDRWLAGEALAVALVLVPAQCLARWTMEKVHLEWRVVLQAIAFTGLMLLVVPAAVLDQTGGTWQPLVDRSPRWNGVLLQILALPAILGLSAVHEFAVRGRGTPLPYDPPERLVTSGPYAYIANPMQLATVLLFVVWAIMLGSVWLMAGSAVALAYGVGLAGWHEDQQLAARFGGAWRDYRRHVPRWWPRWRPAVPAGARLYVAESCATCRGVGEWLAERAPVGLEIVAAEQHPDRDLFRMSYEPDGIGSPDEGVAAFARALEHLNFGWAFVGMFMRLPVVRPCLQLLVDANGGEARLIPRVTNPSGHAPFRIER